jgi:hypothetical protein
MAKRRPKFDNPWDTKLSDEKLKNTTTFLVDELQAALSARSDLIDDYGLIDLWHALYEQQPRNRKGPWPGAADLGSYIGTEKVDTTRSRFMKIIGKAEPLCVVEGRGPLAAKNASIVEEFHEWHQQVEEKLLVSLVRWWHQGLIERVGILETYEKIERVVKVEERSLLVEVDPANTNPETGQAAPVLTDGEPTPVKDDRGKFIDAQSAEEPQAKVKVRDISYIHRGPRHRAISGKDFVWMPAHAKDKDEEVYAYFKRVWLRNDQLAERVANGVYDKDAVEQLGTSGSKTQTATEDRQGVAVQHTGHEATEEHELWEGQVFIDLDGDGPRWHLVTLALNERVMLRLKDDTINRCRFNLVVFFPRSDGVDGYSLIGDKLYTLIEEHTAERNMIADRSVMAFNAPILRISGSNWNPQLQPWGPRQTITINEKDEITQPNVKDVPESGIIRERMTLTAAERVSGASDIVSSGVVEGANPTATQVASSAAYSNARLEEQVTLGQEAIESLYQIRHAMLIRMLEFNDGMEVDDAVVNRLADRGVELADGRITPEMMKGSYRFKPRGSVESADPVIMERKFQQRYSSLFTLAKTVPMLAMKLQDPAIADAILQDWADVYKPRDRAAFLRPAPPPMQAPMMPFGGASPDPSVLEGVLAGNNAPMLPPGGAPEPQGAYA